MQMDSDSLVEKQAQNIRITHANDQPISYTTIDDLVKAICNVLPLHSLNLADNKLTLSELSQLFTLLK